MIGVLAIPEEEALVREFFQLFKTPWEFYRPGERYDAMLCASEELLSVSDVVTELIIIYGGREQQFDHEEKIAVGAPRKGGLLLYNKERVPIYGELQTFLDGCTDLPEEELSRQCAGVRRRISGRNIVRIGYDLFRELRVLLSDGQPHKYAAIPTVEIHIRLLRDLIIESGIRLIEIPPIPAGHAFIACLTHDVDHPSIKCHRWDRTAVGFLYRAVIGSAIDLFKGRIPIRHLLINWGTAAKLPLVYLGLARDFWLDFDRYLSIEGNGGATFFVVPFKGVPGRTTKGSAPSIRATGYEASDIDDRISTIIRNGGEIGLHGIDAWVDRASGQREKAQIEKVTNTDVVGVRMHWLYFNSESPALLEKAGFSYDSTVGYNETVGYRAGTTQVYKPINASHLLELPMHVMDTALFYPAYLGLSSKEATRCVQVLIENAIKLGGTLTFNWHDRSLAPERLWGNFYVKLIDTLKANMAWCTNAGLTVNWYKKRRLVSFHQTGRILEITSESPTWDMSKDTPGLTLRCYNVSSDQSECPKRFVDFPLPQKTIVAIDRFEVIGHSESGVAGYA